MPTFLPTTEIDMNLYSRNDVDFRIQVATPAAGIFTLGQSVLNGTDVLGDSYQWDIYSDELVEISFSNNKDVTSGIFTRPQAKTAEIRVRTSGLNPNLNPDIHPNTRIKLEVKTIDDVSFNSLLTGFINDVQVSYFHDAQPVITINMEDGMNRLLNAPISYTRAAGYLSTTMADFMPLAITAAGLSDPVYTYDYETIVPVYTGYTSQHGALAYTNVTVGQILADLMDAELGNLYLSGTTFYPHGRDAYVSTYYVGNTSDFDTFEIGYNRDYLFSDIVVALTSAPTVQYTLNNSDVSSFFGNIVQNVTVNLQDVEELKRWMASVISRSPALRVTSFSIPKYVPGTMVKITNDVAGETSSILQQAINSNIYVDPTSISTSMQLYQPV